MYHIDGTEFSGLIRRVFTEEPATTQASGVRQGKFSCQTESLRENSFDILQFKADFQQSVHVSDLADTSHVSLHFQLSGHSDACISGFDQALPMGAGHFNILNCADPVSSFTFPAQRQYEYLCIGLKPSFFSQVLSEAGPAYSKLSEHSEGPQSFPVFKKNRLTNHLQREVLQLIQSPPVADSLHMPYIRSKVKELLILSLGHYHQKGVPEREEFSLQDKERLYSTKGYLFGNYLLPLTLEQISRKFLLNEFKLKSGFKKLFGTTVFGYIQQLRMEHAVMLIRSGGYTVGEVAALVGYSSDAAFIRCFKKYYGCSPGKKK